MKITSNAKLGSTYITKGGDKVTLIYRDTDKCKVLNNKTGHTYMTDTNGVASKYTGCDNMNIISKY